MSLILQIEFIVLLLSVFKGFIWGIQTKEYDGIMGNHILYDGFDWIVFRNDSIKAFIGINYILVFLWAFAQIFSLGARFFVYLGEI